MVEFNVFAAEDRVGIGGALVESCVMDAAVVGDVTAVEVAAAVEPALLTSQGFGGDGICECVYVIVLGKWSRGVCEYEILFVI